MLQEIEPSLGGHPDTWINMALLAEGECCPDPYYKHGPPNGGHVPQAAACRTSGVSRQKLIK